MAILMNNLQSYYVFSFKQCENSISTIKISKVYAVRKEGPMPSWSRKVSATSQPKRHLIYQVSLIPILIFFFGRTDYLSIHPKITVSHLLKIFLVKFP